MIELKRKTHTTFLLPIAMIYITVMLLAMVFLHRPLTVGSYVTTCAGLVSPFCFVLNDIIAEIYGYHMAKKVLIYALLCEFIFCFGVVILNGMPGPSSWDGQDHYVYVTHGFLKVFFSVVIGYFISIVLNAYLLIKWKILLKGKFFWLRSIGSSGIAELIYSSITGLIIFYGDIPREQLLSYIIGMCLFKWIGTIILAVPATIFTNILKKIEYVESYDIKSINPLKEKTT